MLLTKIKSGKVEVVNERGILQGSFGSKAIAAYFNDKQDLIVVTLESGKVELTNQRGILKRTIVNTGAKNARFVGEDLAIETDKGKTEIRSQTGTLKRTI